RWHYQGRHQNDDPAPVEWCPEGKSAAALGRAGCCPHYRCLEPSATGEPRARVELAAARFRQSLSLESSTCLGAADCGPRPQLIFGFARTSAQNKSKPKK